ncbi:MAG TPA: ABC transporter permease [Nocardioidaceae bacterium]
MSIRITMAVTRRVLVQLRHDHRTLVLLLFMPAFFMALLWWMFQESAGPAFDRFAPALLAIFPFFVMFLVTVVTTLRERSSGTLERLLAMPMAKLDLLAGYAIAFGLMAALQSAIAVTTSVYLLDLDIAGPVWMLVVVAVVDAVLGSTLGLFLSAFARTEFQAVQFMPAVVTPQVLLCGLFVPRDELPAVLQGISDVLPLSYAVDAITLVSTTTSDAFGGVDSDIWVDLGIVAGFAAAALALGAATLRRRTA